ncbi:transglycosylase domain-containing protein [Bauldia sp.]|uniref:transglycosylase domain-containing protein n=1 Tax=Bauldia sp. TaxID=2575872 RepID=UPI003BADA04A
MVAAKPGTKSGESRTAGNGSGPTIIRRKVAQPKRAGSGKRAPSGSRRTPTARRARRRGFFPTFGRVVRGIVYWSVVVTIIGAAGTAGLIGYYWSKLPPTAEWTLPERPANVRILAANGTLISNRADTVGQTLSLDDMPPYLPEAVIAIEDRRYHWHFGVDPIGLARAMVANVRAGRIVQGGSTLTQQLAKNLFLTPERSFERKVQEVILAVWLEASLSKDEILELYLNRVYLGAGAYGVDAASHRYFGKSARNINLAEAAALAALLKAPSHYSPTANPEATEARTQLVLAAMHEQGYIDDREASLALSQDVRPVRDVAGGSGRYVADWVTAELPRYVGALTRDVIVDTTIDLRLQTLAAGAVTTTLGDLGAERGVSQGAFIAMDPYGGVRALVGGKDYASSPFNRAVDARRQPGSSFKPFVYLTALEHGLIPESVRIDQPVSIKGWRPENYTRQHLGPVTLQSALALSLNTVSAQLAAEVGPAEIAATARRLGVASPLMATPSIALGTSEVGLLEMTGAFASFANGGNGVIPHVIRRIRTVDGEVLYERSGNGPGPVIHPVHVGMMNGMLRDALERGTGKRAIVPGWPAAGKTGTSQDFRDAWFIGYTATLVAGVWFGNDDSTPTKKAAGGNLPAVAWQRFMSTALEGMVVADLPGNYRFRDPANFVDEPTPVATIGDDGEFLFPAPPDASGSVAAGPVHEEPRRGFFRRLFGG